jgi:hypothetical protein
MKPDSANVLEVMNFSRLIRSTSFGGLLKIQKDDNCNLLVMNGALLMIVVVYVLFN